MSNSIKEILFDNDKVQEILKNISTLDLPEAPGVELTPEQKKFAEETNVTNSTLYFFIKSLKGKSNGRDTQVDHTSVVGTSQSVEEKAINACGGLENNLKFEGTSNLQDVSTAKSSDILSEEQEKGGCSR